MKKTFLFSLAVIASLASFAGNPIDKISVKKNTAIAPEDNDNKFSVGLSVGVSIPLQNYGAKTTNADTTHINGYANTGFHYNVTFGYRFSKYVGGMLMVGGSVNSLSPTASSGGASSIPATVTASGSHYVGQYLIGPYATFPIGKKFSIEVRALVGVMTSAYPALSESATASLGIYGSYSFKSDVKPKPGIGFGYNAGIGGKYMLSNHIGLTLNAAYAGTYVTYKGSTQTTTISSAGYFQSVIPNGTTTTTSDTHLHMSLGMINITGGIVYCF